MRNDWFFDKVFPLFFATMFLVFAGVLVVGGGTSAWMFYKCYQSGNPNSIECFLLNGQNTNANVRIQEVR